MHENISIVEREGQLGIRAGGRGYLGDVVIITMIRIIQIIMKIYIYIYIIRYVNIEIV